MLRLIARSSRLFQNGKTGSSILVRLIPVGSSIPKSGESSEGRLEVDVDAMKSFSESDHRPVSEAIIVNDVDVDDDAFCDMLKAVSKSDATLNLEEESLAESEDGSGDMRRFDESILLIDEEEEEGSSSKRAKHRSLQQAGMTKLSSSTSPIQMKRIPECHADIPQIISGIYLNSHLLPFFVKYQKFFSANQLYLLLVQLQQNIEDIEEIRIVETERYELKLKQVNATDGKSEVRHKPEFLNAAQTREHFGYQFLARNLKQKFEFYDITKTTSLLKQSMKFDKQLSYELHEIQGPRVVENRKQLSVYLLIAYVYQAMNQCEMDKDKESSKNKYGWISEVIEELCQRDNSCFTPGILLMILKVRIMLVDPNPVFSKLIQKTQAQFIVNKQIFNTKQLIDLVSVFLEEGLPFEREFIETSFQTIKEQLPVNKWYKIKSLLVIISHFRKQHLLYYPVSPQRISHTQQQQQQQQQQSKRLNDVRESVGEEDEELMESRGHVKVALKNEGLFEVILSSLIREISQFSMKPYQIDVILQSLLYNEIKRQSTFDFVVNEFAKILPKSGFLVFGRIYQNLSDQLLLTKPLHFLTIQKLKMGLSQEEVSLTKLKQNIVNAQRGSENYRRFCLLIVLKLRFSVQNLWCYVLNCVRYQTNADLNVVVSFVTHVNHLIEDIDENIMQELEVTMRTIQQAQQINNYLSYLERRMKRNFSMLRIARLVGNKFMKIKDHASFSLVHSNKMDLMFQLLQRCMQMKYSHEKNVLVQGIIFDLKIKVEGSDSFVLINFTNLNGYNIRGVPKGLHFLQQHFSELENVSFVSIEFAEFEKEIKSLIQSGNQISSDYIENYIERVLLNSSKASLFQKAIKLNDSQSIEIYQLFSQQVQSTWNDIQIDAVSGDWKSMNYKS